VSFWQALVVLKGQRYIAGKLLLVWPKAQHANSSGAIYPGIPAHGPGSHHHDVHDHVVSY
jgi:hypothetical protein